MNPIPGEAGTDYPVYSDVPDTGFDCSQQEFPGIYTDTQADCQWGDKYSYLYFIFCRHFTCLQAFSYIVSYNMSILL